MFRHADHIKIRSLSIVDVTGMKKKPWPNSMHPIQEINIMSTTEKNCWKISMKNKYVVAPKDS